MLGERTSDDYRTDPRVKKKVSWGVLKILKTVMKRRRNICFYSQMSVTAARNLCRQSADDVWRRQTGIEI